MSSNQNQQDNRNSNNNNNNRRNLSYGRNNNNTRGPPPSEDRERTYSDSQQPVQQQAPYNNQRTDQRPRYPNNNYQGNNNNNGRNVRSTSPEAPQGRPLTSSHTNYHREENSSSPSYDNRRREYTRSAPAISNGPPGRPVYQTRRDDSNNYQPRTDDRQDNRRRDDRDYNNTGGHNVGRPYQQHYGGGPSHHHDNNHIFSGKPAPYKQDTNKLPRINSTDFFNLGLEDIRAFVNNEDEVRLKSFKGEAVYNALILHFLGDRILSNQQTRRDFALLRTKYESLFVLSIFLNQGTNFRILFPEFGGRQPDYYGMVLYALLWESGIPREEKPLNLLNLQPWYNIVRNIKEWIDSHVNFERTFPIVEGKEIVWKSSAASDVWKWKESLLHEYEYATPTTTNTATGHDDNRGGVQNRNQGQQGSYQQRQNYGGGDDQGHQNNNRYGGGRDQRDQRDHQGGRGREGGDRRQQYGGNEKYEGNDQQQPQGDNRRQPRERQQQQPRGTSPDNAKVVTTTGNVSAGKAVTEPKVLPTIAYRNVADISSKLVPIVLKEAKIYTEKYGNTMNFVPSAQAGHEWNDIRLRGNSVLGQSTSSTWTGSQCAHCDAFLVRTKVDNKFSNLFIFGLTECPNRRANEWVSNYQKKFTNAYNQAEFPLKDKFSANELKEWGFLVENEEVGAGEGK